MPPVGQAVREQVKVEVDSEPFWGVPKTASTGRLVVPVSNPSFRTADGSWQDEGYRGIPSTNFTSVKTPGMGEFSYEFPAYADLIGFYLASIMGVEAAPAADAGESSIQELWIGYTTGNSADLATKKFRIRELAVTGTVHGSYSTDLTMSSTGLPPAASVVQTALRSSLSDAALSVTGAGTFEDPYLIVYSTAGVQGALQLSAAATDGIPSTVSVGGRRLRPGRSAINAGLGRLYTHAFSLLGGGGVAAFQPAGRPNSVVPPSLTHYYGQGVRVDAYEGGLLSQLELSWNAGEGALMASVEGQSKRQRRLDPASGFGRNTADDANIGGSPFMGYTSAVFRGGEFRGRIMSATHTFTRELSVIHTGDGSESLDPEAIRAGGLALRSNFVLNYVSESDLNVYLEDVKESFETRYSIPGTNDALIIKSNDIAYNIEPASEDLGEAAPKLNLSVVHLFNTTNFGPCEIDLVNGRSTAYVA